MICSAESVYYVEEQIQSRNRLLDHAARTTRQHELDHTDLL